MKKICVVTATRAEYGYLKWLMKDILADSELELQVIATGTHLDKTQGYTVDQIIADSIPVTEEVDVKLDNSYKQSLYNPKTTYYIKAKYIKRHIKESRGSGKYYDENVDFHLKNEIAKL